MTNAGGCATSRRPGSRPVVCLDECPEHLRDDVRPPLPPAPKRPRRRDDEYRRCGTACLAVAFDPHRGWRHVAVSERRTMRDVATVSKRWFRVRGTYGVDVGPGQKAPVILAATVCIDWLVSGVG